MLGPGTQSIYVPERYRNANTFVRYFYAKFEGHPFRLGHVAPSGKEIYFVSEPTVPFEWLNKWEDELWDKENNERIRSA